MSLADYVAAMKPEQEKIYFLIADTAAAARNSAYLEVFRKQGVEVLLLSERIDEWTMQGIPEFDGKQLQDISRGELDLGELGDQDEAKEEENSERNQRVVETIKSVLGEKVEDVRASHRLTESPACLVLGQGDVGAQMRKILEAAGQAVPDTKPTLEINLEHKLVTRLDGEEDQAKVEDLVGLLFDQAKLAAGEQLENPALFVQRINRLL